MVAQFTFPAIVHVGSIFSAFSPTLVICCLFDNSPSDRCKVISHWGFDLHFPGDKWYWVYFPVLVSHLYVFFGKMFIQIFCPFFNWIFFFFGCWVVWVLCTFWILAPYQIYDLQIFFPHSLGCLFILLMVSFAVQKPFSLMYSHLFIFAFVVFAFGVKFTKSSSRRRSRS